MEALRTAKLAFDEGLIAEPDFQRVRDAFVAAQQIRTGIEGGLLREEEVQDLRERFIDLLHHNMGSRRSDGGQTAAAHSRANHPPAAPAHPGPGVASPITPQAASRVTGGSGPPPPPPIPGRNAAAGAASAAPPRSNPPANAPPPPPLPRPAPILPPAGPSAPTEASHTPDSVSRQSSASPMVARPAAAVANGTASSSAASRSSSTVRNMAGVQLDAGVSDEYYRMRTRRAYRWITFRIDTGFIVVDARGESRDGDNGWVSFFAALPPQEPRYAVYDHHFMSQDGHLYNKLVFVLWSPDEASTRLKMTYAAAKDGIKQALDGLAADVQASTADEVSLGSIDTLVRARVTSG